MSRNLVDCREALNDARGFSTLGPVDKVDFREAKGSAINERENAELISANEILWADSIFLAAKLDGLSAKRHG